MRIFLETRDGPRSRDYRFLGASPEDAWWRTYSRLTEFERPSFVLESTGSGARMHLTGLRTMREDVTGTVIRCTLSVDEIAGADDLDEAMRLIGAWLLEDPLDPSSSLNRLLDKHFTTDLVAATYGSDDASVDGSLRSIAAALDAPEIGDGRPGSWLGADTSPTARRDLLAHARDVIRSGRGTACVLNAASDAQARDWAQQREEVVALIPGGPEPAVAVERRPTAELVSSPPGKSTPGWSRRWTSKTIAIATALVLVAMAALLLLLL